MRLETAPTELGVQNLRKNGKLNSPALSEEWQSAISGQQSERIGVRSSLLLLAVSWDDFGGDGEGQCSLVWKVDSEE